MIRMFKIKLDEMHDTNYNETVFEELDEFMGDTGTVLWGGFTMAGIVLVVRDNKDPIKPRKRRKDR